MDLTPSFGHQELLETLSQASSGGNSHSISTGGIGSVGGGNRSVTSHHSSTSKSAGRGASSSSSSGDRKNQQHYAASSGGSQYSNNSNRLKNYQQNHSGNNPYSCSSSTGRGESLHRYQSGGSAASIQTNTSISVDEAVRRLGYRLSLQAHGDTLPSEFSASGSSTAGSFQAPRRVFKASVSTSFEPYQFYLANQRKSMQSGSFVGNQDFNMENSDAKYEDNQDHPGINKTKDFNVSLHQTITSSTQDQIHTNNGGSTDSSASSSNVRTSKVARIRYASDNNDHGSKSNRRVTNIVNSTPSNLLRKITYEAKDRFQEWIEPTEYRPQHDTNASNPDDCPSTQPQHKSNTNSNSGLEAEYKTSSSPSRQDQRQQDPHRYQHQDADHLFYHNQRNLDELDDQQQLHSTLQQRQHSQFHNGSHANEFQSQGSGGIDSSTDQWGVSRNEIQQRRLSSTKAMAIGHNAVSTTKGLLSAVLEGHSDSSTTRTGGGDQSVMTSPSISTKASSLAPGAHINHINHHPHDHLWQTQLPSHQQALHGQHPTLPENEPLHDRGRCLTTPAEPVANNGLDNVEGNLIVHEHDVIRVSRKHLHTLSKPSNSKEHTSLSTSAEYRILALQGQGTFAQVFQCLELETNRKVAMKVIKNKPAYTRQAAIEIDIFQTLQEDDKVVGLDTTQDNRRQRSQKCTPEHGNDSAHGSKHDQDYMVNLICYFMYQNHLCLVFELLGLNLYDVLKQRQFRGLPLTLVREIIQQSVEGIRDLAQKNVVHCDLKPENILLISDSVNKEVLSAGDVGKKGSTQDASTGNSAANETATTTSSTSTAAAGSLSKAHCHGKEDSGDSRKIKLIDFGSACFEGYTAHTYIQSRFYRSPEVLIGVPYDSAIDMWSLGCVAAELFLGLPILPGVHEHDQVGRIIEMVALIPSWMLDQGTKSTKYYVKTIQQNNMIQDQHSSPASIDPRTTPSPGSILSGPSPAPSRPQWRIKTQQEYINSLSQSEIRKKGGLARLQRQLGNRYFKRTKLVDILLLHAKTSTGEEKQLLPAFIHFLYGILDPDPWKRWTAFQASHHPFISGKTEQLRPKMNEINLNINEENQANVALDIYWQAPFDPAICRRKLLNVQKLREKQQANRRNQSGRPNSAGGSIGDSFSDRRRSRPGEQSSSIASMLQSISSTNDDLSRVDGSSPPNQVSTPGSTSASQISHYIPALPRTSAGVSDVNNTDSLIQQNSMAMQLSGSASIPDNNVTAEEIQNHMHQHGPQSFTGMSGGLIGTTPTEVDFGYALQRPGVIPDGVSMSSLGSAQGFSQQPLRDYNQFGGQPVASTSFSDGRMSNFADMNSYPVSLSSYGQNQPMISRNMNSVGSRGGSSSMMMSSFVDSNSAGFTNVNNPYLPAASPSLSTQGGSGYGRMLSSASSSVNMTDGSYMDPQQQILQLQHQQLQQQHQQQQHILLQQQQIQQQHQQQQQQQQQQQLLGFGHPQLGMGQQQHPQLGLQHQQQPLFLAGAPGGGYYYVTTSVTGQPILLQPVGVLNPDVTQPGATGYAQPLGYGQSQLPIIYSNVQQQQNIGFNPMIGSGNQNLEFLQRDQQQNLDPRGGGLPQQRQHRQLQPFDNSVGSNSRQRFRGGSSM